MIKQADIEDIPAIEEIMLDAVHWLKEKGIENLWTESNVKWEALSKSFQISDFYILYQEGVPIASMALSSAKDFYWPDVPEGESIYLHKLAMKRAYSGHGRSKELIDYAKEKARALMIKDVRLDCNSKRKKLRQLYESNGFVFVEEVKLGDYGLALYDCKL